MAHKSKQDYRTIPKSRTLPRRWKRKCRNCFFIWNLFR